MTLSDTDESPAGARADDMGETLDRAVKDSLILIVDDNAANVELLREILTHSGYRRVRCETDPRKVPALCAAERHDLLLIDIRMPHMSGFELMELLRPIHAGDRVPVLVLTAQTDQETRRMALEHGAGDFLTKPFIAWELQHRVRNMLEIRKLYLSVADQNRELERRVAVRTVELREALTAAQQADRAKLDFLSVMSHELRTPLNSIIGFAEILARETDSAPDRTDRGRADRAGADTVEYATLIEESGKALLTMVNNILDFARGASGAVELSESEVPLSRLLATCIALLGPKAQAKRLTVTVDSGPAITLRADPRRLREMALNLLDNAVKFTQPGGRITVRVAHTPGGIDIVVSDDGPGMAPDLAARVFNPFSQSERSLVRKHEGIGLGLPIVRRFAELHGGSVTLDTAPGMGTTVAIRLPADRMIGVHQPV